MIVEYANACLNSSNPITSIKGACGNVLTELQSSVLLLIKTPIELLCRSFLKIWRYTQVSNCHYSDVKLPCYKLFSAVGSHPCKVTCLNLSEDRSFPVNGRGTSPLLYTRRFSHQDGDPARLLLVSLPFFSLPLLPLLAASLRTLPVVALPPPALIDDTQGEIYKEIAVCQSSSYYLTRQHA